MNNIHSEEREIEILEWIHTSKTEIHQRDLAKIVGVSVGMTNAILKRLAHKGWLQIKKVNNRNIQYIVSAKGIEKIATRSYRYFRRTIKNVVLYKEAMEQFLTDVQDKGFTVVVLVGKSDLDFIVEHVCIKKRLTFRRSKSLEQENLNTGKQFFLLSENKARDVVQHDMVAHLGKILIDT